MSTRAYLGLGSNLGDRCRNLARALELLERRGAGRVAAASSRYLTSAWGRTDQPPFLNQVVALDTELGAEELLRLVQQVEEEMGRERREPWGPRVIDIDLLLYGEARIASPGLTVPHPWLTQRAFVLIPLLELWPQASLPDGRPLAAALRRLEERGEIGCVQKLSCAKINAHEMGGKTE